MVLPLPVGLVEPGGAGSTAFPAFLIGQSKQNSKTGPSSDDRSAGSLHAGIIDQSKMTVSNALISEVDAHTMPPGCTIADWLI